MAMGLTYADEIGRVGTGSSPKEVVELVARALALPAPVGDYCDIPEDRKQFLPDVLGGVMRCSRNPCDYLSPERRPAVVVPVGQVSTARPRGVMGNILVGYETNALDVLGDESAFRSPGKP